MARWRRESTRWGALSATDRALKLKELKSWAESQERAREGVDLHGYRKDGEIVSLCEWLLSGEPKAPETTAVATPVARLPYADD